MSIEIRDVRAICTAPEGILLPLRSRQMSLNFMESDVRHLHIDIQP